MKKLIFLYGAIAGVITTSMLLYTFGQSTPDFENSELFGYTMMIIAFTTIFFAIKSHRDKKLEGVITFGKAFKLGLGITLVASVIYITAWVVISETIASDFVEQYTEYSMKQWKSDNFTQEEIEVKLAEMKTYGELYENPLFKIAITFTEIFPIGFIISLLSAIALKRKKKNSIKN